MSKSMQLYRAILFINRSNSVCGFCGHGADPDAKSHDVIMNFDNNGEQGCGVTWEILSTEYLGDEAKEDAMRIRPDLPFKCIEEIFPK